MSVTRKHYEFSPKIGYFKNNTQVYLQVQNEIYLILFLLILGEKMHNFSCFLISIVIQQELQILYHYHTLASMCDNDVVFEALA